MVLKRLFVTALGALGLGALAAGPVSAQQVPPPDFFGDQMACSSANAMAMPPNPLEGTGTNMMGPSLLDQALRGTTGMGDPITIDATGDAGMSLNYVIDATVANCGAGSGVAVLETDNANYQLALGYTEVLTQFEAVVREEGEVRTAQRNLNNAIQAGTTGTPLENLRKILTDAQADLAREQTKLNALGAGPIYQAGIREWRAKGAVDAAITKWDTAVPMVTARLSGGTIGGETVAGLRAASYGDYVVLPGQTLLDALTNAAGELQRGALGAYLGETTDGITAGFDANGRLILPDSDDNDVPDVTATTVGTIMDNSMKVDAVVTALEKAVAETSDLNQARRLNEALRRARQEKTHLNEYLRRALNDNSELDAGADTTAADYVLDSIRTRNAAYQKALGDRNSAEAELRSAVAARHAATGAVQMAFQGPASYFDQFVARRMYHANNAQKAVTDARADGITPSKTLTDAVTDTQKALSDATTARDRYQAMVADSDNPAVNLIQDLLVPDNQKADDDGQAVVDAVSQTYDVAKDARDTANRVADEVSGLTGEGGDVAMNTARIGENATNISENADNITMLDGRVTANETEIGMDENGMSRIDHNEARSMANATAIGENKQMIMTNAESIMTNAGNIATNAGNIKMNSDEIMMNAGQISSNSDRIGANEMAIAGLDGRVGSNESAIMRNTGMISDLNESLEVVRAGVAASMALAGMPAINGRGISIGVGSFDGESAFAVGFMIQGEMASFKVGVTSAGGATGASAGVGFQF